jgi:hypothetical protein
MTAYLHVVWTAGCSGPLEFRSHLTVVYSRFHRERQHIETRHEMLDGREVVGASSRFFRAVVQLAKRNARDTELFGQ